MIILKKRGLKNPGYSNKHTPNEFSNLMAICNGPVSILSKRSNSQIPSLAVPIMSNLMIARSMILATVSTLEHARPCSC